MTQLSLIVAMDENRLIGSARGLPWRMPADLEYFKRTTMGKPVVMGRVTFESIGRALPGRRNIVITRDPQFSAADCEVAGGIDEALALCAEADEIMLIGGASLYRQTLQRASRLYLTRIHHSFEGDTWFPEFEESDWQLESEQRFEADSSNPYAFSVQKFVREI
ncbi:MAG: dihydrofolate reductase [Gammaproteobacteria bacterium]|jgi:dihydrofolate reductase